MRCVLLTVQHHINPHPNVIRARGGNAGERKSSGGRRRGGRGDAGLPWPSGAATRFHTRGGAIVHQVSISPAPLTSSVSLYAYYITERKRNQARCLVESEAVASSSSSSSSSTSSRFSPSPSSFVSARRSHYSTSLFLFFFHPR